LQQQAVPLLEGILGVFKQG